MMVSDIRGTFWGSLFPIPILLCGGEGGQFRVPIFHKPPHWDACVLPVTPTPNPRTPMLLQLDVPAARHHAIATLGIRHVMPPQVQALRSPSRRVNKSLRCLDAWALGSIELGSWSSPKAGVHARVLKLHSFFS